MPASYPHRLCTQHLSTQSSVPLFSTSLKLWLWICVSGLLCFRVHLHWRWGDQWHIPPNVSHQITETNSSLLCVCCLACLCATVSADDWQSRIEHVPCPKHRNINSAAWEQDKTETACWHIRLLVRRLVCRGLNLKWGSLMKAGFGWVHIA